MRIKRENCKIKLIIACALAVSVISTGIVVTPTQAEAAVVDDKLIYSNEFDVNSYWQSNNKTAPIKEGYVFGGWYVKADEHDASVQTLYSSQNDETGQLCKPLTSNDMDNLPVETAVYAKFVPARVLSVMAQNDGKLTYDAEKGVKQDGNEISQTNKTYVRVMTSLDSGNYNKVGFDIYLANQTNKLTLSNGGALETNKLYDCIIADGQSLSASELFEGVSEKICTCKLAGITTEKNLSKKIFVTPYWETRDGTKVYGLGEYVHMEDEYMGYLNVPINLKDLTLDVSANVAAGKLKVTGKDVNGMTVSLTEIAGKEDAFEVGKIFPEMTFHYENGVVMIVGNVGKNNSGVYADVTTNNIYANLRFVKPDENSSISHFDVELVEFANMNEQYITTEKIGVYDVKY